MHQSVLLSVEKVCMYPQKHCELPWRLKCKHISVIIEAGTHKAKYRVKSCRALHNYEWTLR